jgi:CheY-like chemotaxis protein/DNA-directed RNA polymerase specialized sigma24 family protein
MSQSRHEIAARVPYLRRYARALTGSQATGDQYVRICLEMIVEDPEILPSTGDMMRDMFRLFHRVWTETSPTHIMTHASVPRRQDAGAFETYRGLPAVERQVLLLAALERYSFGDIAFILSITEDEARSYFNQAQLDIRDEPSVPIFIIEDEKVIAYDLRAIVEDMGHTVCGVAEREDEAVELAARAKPRVILADIQLKDGGSGIAAVRKILEKIEAPVIFITAYPEFLLTGNAPEPAFVITKPFNRETIIAAVSQAVYVSKPRQTEKADRDDVPQLVHPESGR